MDGERYQLEIADASYYRKIISCQNACPVHTDAQGYVNAVAKGWYQDGYIMARQPKPFASICGRVCNAPCEGACRRGKIDASISIRALKRFLCERYGVEAKERFAAARTSDERCGIDLLGIRTPGNSSTVEGLATLLRASAAEPVSRKGRVAVIGAGPAGLTAAHDLAILGYQVTVFEASSTPGGMLLLGIPEYRLPRDVIRQEIEEILSQGVELKLNMRLGRDFYLATLRETGYDAIFIAIGAYLDRALDVEGSDLEGVMYSLDFLQTVNLGYRTRVGNRVLVIGGGGTAVDTARTTLRLGEELVEKDGIAAMDAARGALRLGAREVHVIYRGMRWEMRAPDEEIEDAVAEGILLHTGRAPKRVLGENGRVTGLETIRVQSIVNEEGRPRRTFIPNSEEVFLGDTVIAAVGQGSDLSFIRKEDGIQVTPEATILIDLETLATTAPGIYAGGDVAFGPRIIIESVKDGHRAARSIDRYLQKAIVHQRATFREVSVAELPAEGWLDIAKRRPPVLSLEKRTGVSEVELAYDEATAVEQASRCLRCHIQTVFNGDLCILCGGCVDVCPWSCLKMVGLDKIGGDQALSGVIQARYNLTLESFQKGSEALNYATAMIKDETRCTRCGLCAKRCPVGAITMEAFSFEEELVYGENEDKVPQETGVRG